MPALHTQQVAISKPTQVGQIDATHVHVSAIVCARECHAPYVVRNVMRVVWDVAWGACRVLASVRAYAPRLPRQQPEDWLV